MSEHDALLLAIKTLKGIQNYIEHYMHLDIADQITFDHDTNLKLMLADLNAGIPILQAAHTDGERAEWYALAHAGRQALAAGTGQEGGAE